MEALSWVDGMLGFGSCWRTLDILKGSLGSKVLVNGGTMPYSWCAGSDVSKGGGLPKPKMPMLSRLKFSMMVSLFLSMIALMIVACPG